MNIGLDIDGTITANPAVYLFLAKAWMAMGGQVHIITARSKIDHAITIEHLADMGFNEIPYTLHIYPHEYDYRDQEELYRHFQAHSAWKADVCRNEGIHILIDDDPRNLIAAREAGIYSLSAGFVHGR